MVLGRRAPRLLSASERLKRFGRYELVLPGEAVLQGRTLRMSPLEVPEAIERPDYDRSGMPVVTLDEIHINTAAEIAGIRAACGLARKVLAAAATVIAPGVSTIQVDEAAHRAIVAAGAYPSPLNYRGFPRAVCTSVNNVICHGIPDERLLVDGDIVNVDVTVYLNGFHGDTSATFLVGNVDTAGRELVEATQESLKTALSVCGPGVPFSAIGNIISEFAGKHGYQINRDFCGHGIGRHFHQPPLVLHYANSEPETMEEGMTFTIEPILCQGVATYVKWPDGWTVVTQDGGRAAQFEHTVLVGPDGVEVLT
nr:Methionine aminopeptidase 1D, chloroplastic/mitochondrial [Polyrhizophydium stewartii]